VLAPYMTKRKEDVLARGERARLCRDLNHRYDKRSYIPEVTMASVHQQPAPESVRHGR